MNKLYICFILMLLSILLFSQNNDTEKLQQQIDQKNIEIRNLKKTAIIKGRESDEEILIRNLTVVLTILITSTFFLLYHKYQLNQYKKYQKKINQHQSELYSTIISIQDNERKRIAEDLHDGLGSSLSTIKLNLARMEEENLVLTVTQKNNFQKSLALLDDASVELRNIAHNIMPATLSKLGLVSALKNLFDSTMFHSDLKIKYSTHDFAERLNESAEINIYRVLLELLNNIIKHAEANEIIIQFIKYPEYINITIEDNGKGFNYEAAKEMKKGMGLTNISSRVEYLKGKLDVDSSAGRGTTVFIEIPLKEIQNNG